MYGCSDTARSCGGRGFNILNSVPQPCTDTIDPSASTRITTGERRIIRVWFLAWIRGGSCVGCAFLIQAKNVADVIAYLNERELIGYAYTPRIIDVTLKDGKEAENITVPSYTYVADLSHEHYAGSLPIAEAARLIMNAEGIAGLNRDYLINTVRHLEQTGFAEPELHALLRDVEARTGMIDIGGGI